MQELILAGLFLAAAVYLAGDWLFRRRRCRVQVQATVAQVEQNRPGQLRRESRHFYPVYTFVLNGREYQVRPAQASRTNQWQPGQRVSLWVDPQDPDRFRTGNELSDLLFAAASLALSALCVAIHLL